jgi:hypothetical protein
LRKPQQNPTFSGNLIYALSFVLLWLKLHETSSFPSRKLSVKFEMILRSLACPALTALSVALLALRVTLSLSPFCVFASKIFHTIGQFP